MLEYKYGLTFSWKENIYGSTFFATTGFHGFHVTIGTIFLIFCLARVYPNVLYYWMLGKADNFFLKLFTRSLMTKESSGQKEKLSSWALKGNKLSLTKEQHVGFEAAAWYWHFVDVVWIFLFLTVYWWGSY